MIDAQPEAEPTDVWSEAAMQARVVRYGDLVPCRNAFIDTRSPGSEAKENFTIIGPGVSENPEQHVHINEPHGFNIGAARQPPHCVNSQHSHQTAEVFVVHSGTWTFNFGEHGDDCRIAAGPGALASIPTNLFRGFSNVGDDVGFLWVALGGDDPGHVLWAPYVFDMARDYGLALLDDGRLIDTVKGEAVPADAQLMPRTSPAQVAALATPPEAALRRCIVMPDGFADQPAGPLTGPGVDERLTIAPTAQINWPHGFTLSRAVFAAGAGTDQDAATAPEVLFVHEGTLEMVWADGRISLAAGDTFTVPQGVARRYASSTGAAMFIVRGA
jgi:quercetin dioxygenase-like cupin family protein